MRRGRRCPSDRCGAAVLSLPVLRHGLGNCGTQAAGDGVVLHRDYGAGGGGERTRHRRIGEGFQRGDVQVRDGYPGFL